MAAVVVFWDRALQVGKVIPQRWSLNGIDTEGVSAQFLLIHIMVLKCMFFVCNLTKYF